MSWSMAAIEWPADWLDGELVGFRQEAHSEDLVIASACTDKGTNLWLLVGDGLTMFGRFICEDDGSAGPWEEQIVGEPTELATAGWKWVRGAVEAVRAMSLAELLAPAREDETGGELL